MILEINNYIAKVEPEDDEWFHGRILNIRDVVTFMGRSLKELRREFEASLNDYEDMCREFGKEPERPYSGKFQTRIDPALHAQVASAAASAGVSMNAWVAEQLERSVETVETR